MSAVLPYRLSILAFLLLYVSVSVQERCPALCPPGERSVFIGNETNCAKYVVLGQPCQSGADSLIRCARAYSSCQSGVCNCLPGFKSQENYCVPKKIHCPGSDSINSARQCRIYYNQCIRSTESRFDDSSGPAGISKTASGNLSLADRLSSGIGCLPSGHSPLYTAAKANSSNSSFSLFSRASIGANKRYQNIDCPSTHFCHLYGAYKLNGCQVVGFGYCCPQSCPLGDPHPDATCDAGAAVKCSHQEGYYCRRSYLTEEALTFGWDIDKSFLSTCCPSHCPPGTLAMNDGHCIPKAKFMEACWRDEQCPYTSVCRKGLCQCAENETIVFEKRGAKCVQRNITLGLGDRCTERSVCSVEHSFCNFCNLLSSFFASSYCSSTESRTAAGVCTCICGYKKRGNICVKESGESCPDDKHRNCSTWANQGKCNTDPDWMRINCPKSCDSC